MTSVSNRNLPTSVQQPSASDTSGAAAGQGGVSPAPGQATLQSGAFQDPARLQEKPDKYDTINQQYQSQVVLQGGAKDISNVTFAALGSQSNAALHEQFLETQNAYGNIIKAGGDVSHISEQDFASLAKEFSSLPPNLQASIKTSLNTLFPGKTGETGSAVGDALQFASDGLRSGDQDAAKNRFQDLQKLSGTSS